MHAIDVRNHLLLESLLGPDFLQPPPCPLHPLLRLRPGRLLGRPLLLHLPQLCRQLFELLLHRCGSALIFLQVSLRNKKLGVSNERRRTNRNGIVHYVVQLVILSKVFWQVLAKYLVLFQMWIQNIFFGHPISPHTCCPSSSACALSACPERVRANSRALRLADTEEALACGTTQIELAVRM